MKTMLMTDQLVVIGSVQLAEVAGGIDYHQAIDAGLNRSARWGALAGTVGGGIGLVAGGVTGGVAGAAVGGAGAIPGALAGAAGGAFTGSMIGSAGVGAIGFTSGAAQDIIHQVRGR
jgi:hypothetical protein